MSDDTLRRFVSSFLHQTLGCSEDTSVDYLIATARNAQNHNDILSELNLCGIKHNDESNEFAQSLYTQALSTNKVKQQKLKQKNKRKEFHSKLMEQQKNKSYKLVSFDIENENQIDSKHASSSSKKRSKKHKKDKKNKHKFVKKRDREKSDYDNDKQPHKKRKMNTSEKEELERLKDQREKAEFEARMKKKDLERRQKLSEEQMDRLEEERKRKALQFGDQKQMERARIISSRQYKKKRVEQQLYLYSKRIEDEQENFGDHIHELTEKEIERQKLSKNILNIAHETIKNRKEEFDGYYIPSQYDRTEEGLLDKKARQNVMKGRYKEDEEMRDGTYRHEQEKWEESRIRDAIGNDFVSDKWAKKAKEEMETKKYEPILEDAIEFISDALEKGKDLEHELKEEIENEESNLLKHKEAKKQSLAQFRTTLPVYSRRDDLMNVFEEYQILIIEAATGSGKTTQIPQYIYEERERFLYGVNKDNEEETTTLKIGITQPRRVAAMSVAQRVSKEMDCRLGGTVGYSVRFEDKTSTDTVIKYMTDGMLLRELLIDSTLSGYGVIIIDEAHERTLHTDILFGLLKDLCRARKDLKVIISSATLQASKFCDFFDNAPKYVVPGRSFNIDIYYLKAPEANYVEAVCISVLQFHVTQPLGDILVFLTGQEEIELIKQSLEQRTRKLGKRIKELIILPIYANLAAEQQVRIFEPTPPNARKVVLATNIAETSLTIDNIVYVIDPGFNKQNNYSPRTGMDSLCVVPISKASAEQRAGRAGRTANGKCFRLYTKDAFMNQMEEMTVPEIQRTNLATVVLLLKSLGINDLIHFDFMDSPPAETLMRALELLYGLGALNSRGELTTLGRKMAEFPIDPQLSKCLCHSQKFECCKEILTICCMLSANHQIFYIPKEQDVAAETLHKNFYKEGGDHYTLLNIYNQWKDDTNYSKNWCQQNFIQFRALNRARDIREQLENLCERVEIDPNVSIYDRKDGDVHDEDHVVVNEDNIGKAMVSGYFFQTAKISNSGQYKTIRFNEEVMIHPSSSLSKSELLPKWVLFHNLILTSSEFMRNVIQIEPQWISQSAPHFYKQSDVEKAKAKMPKKAIKNHRMKPNYHQH